jgi:predicted DNA-binding transcriptional regulator YafY
VNRVQRFNRMLNILSEVVRHPGRHPGDLADACGVSERTLRRDLAELRRRGFELGYLDGYQLQGTLDLDGMTPVAAKMEAVPVVYEQQVRFLYSSFPRELATQIEARVEELAPGALAALFARAIAEAVPGGM